jgi:hypothetical protein
MKFQIQQVCDGMLSEVAEFLHRWHQHREARVSIRAVPKSPQKIEQSLKWLLIENPVVEGHSHHGFFVSDEAGVIRGLSLNFPNAFVFADRRVLGLCSGSYFVEPQVRTAGYYLFKRYLDSPGYAFYFATTCNANSSAIWEKLGGTAVPDSGTEYILPLRFDVMLPAFLGRKFRSRLAAGISKAVGRGGNLVCELLRPMSTTLTVERCRDWEKLSELSHRHRPQNLMTAERSARFLQWRYGPTSPNHSAEICVFRNGRGSEGWFALGERMLGRDGHIRSAILLDAVWPRSHIHFREILPAVVQRASGWADAVFFPSRPRLNYRECSRLVVSRRFEAPRSWAMGAKGSTSLDWSCLDLVTADGDNGWSNRFENEAAASESSNAAVV